ncbi:sodium-dependent nutrient amino acid transporter 1-like [Uloborus diversus]|uniref:sodium-dependent nutrient amino acid transporter 1-like n=1 Tax=Uloborus diversus TaxID=327109 RepID=UPI0024096393|nr:sodium-dependent nutrient amino acid transporter 1-like [Uloborus diversus]
MFMSSSYNLQKHERDSFDVPRISVSQLPPLQSSRPSGETESPARGTWDKSIQSLLLCLSMSVGLGNIWRFPNIAYNNGGGAFLIPYLLLLFIIGRPLYYLELILGQFCSQGPIKMWRMVPALKGVGYAQVVSVSYIIVFYNYLMALSLFYIFASWSECLPWTLCDSSSDNRTTELEGNFSSKMIPQSELFWTREVLQQTGPDDALSISWKLALCLLLTWIIVYLAVIQGTSSLGKMSYFTAIFPFFGLTSLLIVACFEEGAWQGIQFFFQPDLEKLKDIQVWYKACEQSFFSLTIAYGNIVMIASYNKFRNNVYRDAIIISVLDTVVNLMAGCVSFAVLGSLAYKYEKDIRQVVDHQGLGLAFVVYPEALAAIQYVPQLWSVVFFFMLFVLGIGSSMSMIETLLTVLKDKFPVLRKRKWLLALGICAMFFALGLPLTTNIGQLILVLLNNYGAGVAVFFYAVLEVIAVSWIYGLKNFCRDVEFMLERPPGIFWKFTWAVTAPLALTVIFIFGVAKEQSSGDSAVPQWATAIGWFLAAFALIQIPLWIIVTVWKDPSEGIRQKIANAFRPAENWGPADPFHNAAWRTLKKPALDGAAYENKNFREDVF